MTLRARITVLTGVLLLLSTIALGAVAYSTARRIQIDTLDRSLVGAAQEVRPRALQRQANDTVPIRGAAVRDPAPVPDDVYMPYAVGLIKPGDDKVDLLRPAGFGSQPLPFPELTKAQVVQGLSGAFTLESTPTYRVLTRESGGNGGLLVIATPIDDLQAGLNRLGLGLLLSVLSISALGAFAAWVIVRRFFRPVDEMVLVAGEIAAGRTDLRVPDAPARTELGVLSLALNQMIGYLTEAIRGVEASEGRLRAFVSDASHEIRTPLTVIRGYVELLQGQPRSSSDLETRALDRISAESRRLEGLVTQLLLLERIDAGSSPTETFDLLPLVREHVGDLAYVTEAGGNGVGQETRVIDWHVESVTIDGNPDMWRQVLANLTQNLNRYTPAGSPVAITLSRLDGMAVLMVDDAGPGIPVDQRVSVTGRFTRLDASRSSTTGGFGLGMSVVSAVVARHHGTLELLDSPLGGLRVRITLPAR